MIRGFLRLSVLLWFVMFFVAACGQEQPPNVHVPVKKKVKVTAQPSSKDVMPVTNDLDSAPPAYVYDPAGQRDPFEALVMIRKPVVENGKPMTPLQQYDLSQFRLSAVIIGKEPMAMVVAPGGKAFVLRPGVRIGKNGGVVTKVSPEVVYVEEKFYDFTGKLSATNLEIRFTQKAGDN